MLVRLAHEYGYQNNDPYNIDWTQFYNDIYRYLQDYGYNPPPPDATAWWWNIRWGDNGGGGAW